MTIPGGIKFFYKNRGDIDDDSAGATVSSGTTTRYNARSRRQWVKWVSEGSDDVTTETYDLLFGASYDIDRIILNRHNFKAFTVKYWNGSAWAHFSSVVTNEGTQTNITETANTKTTSYYEFASVNTEKIRVEIDTTQTVDAEKYMYECIATKEIGTFTGYPHYQGSFGKEKAAKKSLAGTVAQTILGQNFSCSLAFARYPTEADHTIMQTLWNLNDAFLIYPCGGDNTQYRYTSLIGNRLRDIYLVGFTRDFSPNYDRNVYALGLNYGVSFSEVP